MKLKHSFFKTFDQDKLPLLGYLYFPEDVCGFQIQAFLSIGISFFYQPIF